MYFDTLLHNQVQLYRRLEKIKYKRNKLLELVTMLVGKMESSENGKTIKLMSNGKEKGVSEPKPVKTKAKEEKNLSDSQPLDAELTALHTHGDERRRRLSLEHLASISHAMP
jgi:hypothetical protein